MKANIEYEMQDALGTLQLWIIVIQIRCRLAGTVAYSRNEYCSVLVKTDDITKVYSCLRKENVHGLKDYEDSSNMQVTVEEFPWDARRRTPGVVEYVHTVFNGELIK